LLGAQRTGRRLLRRLGHGLPPTILDEDSLALLRPRRERPRSRPAEQRDELASLHQPTRGWENRPSALRPYDGRPNGASGTRLTLPQAPLGGSLEWAWNRSDRGESPSGVEGKIMGVSFAAKPRRGSTRTCSAAWSRCAH